VSHHIGNVQTATSSASAGDAAAAWRRCAHAGRGRAHLRGDLTADLVGQALDATLYTANLRTVQAADKVLGSLLDAVA
jgi:hypothetical protein